MHSRAIRVAQLLPSWIKMLIALSTSEVESSALLRATWLPNYTLIDYGLMAGDHHVYITSTFGWQYYSHIPVQSEISDISSTQLLDKIPTRVAPDFFPTFWHWDPSVHPYLRYDPTHCASTSDSPCQHQSLPFTTLSRCKYVVEMTDFLDPAIHWVIRCVVPW